MLVQISDNNADYNVHPNHIMYVRNMKVDGKVVPDYCIVILSNGHKITANKGKSFIVGRWMIALDKLNS